MHGLMSYDRVSTDGVESCWDKAVLELNSSEWLDITFGNHGADQVQLPSACDHVESCRPYSYSATIKPRKADEKVIVR